MPLTKPTNEMSVEDILRRQLELLAEKSEHAQLSDLILLSSAMKDIANVLISI